MGPRHVSIVKVAKKYIISGRVQAVGYRFFAERVANQLGICGYVKNLWDDTVEVYAIGDEASLEEFRRHLARGPRSALVTGIEESEAPVKSQYSRFLIEGTW
jgi:acylphosphatase